jgi:hypothetical protein
MSGYERPTAMSGDDRDADRPAAGGQVPAAAEEPPIWSAAANTEVLLPGTPPASTEPTAAPGPRRWFRRPRNLVLIGLAVVALVLAAVFGPLSWGLWSTKDTRIGTPSRIAGLVLDDSQNAQDTIDYLRTAIETGVSLQHTTGAVYTDGATQSHSVLFVGGTGALISPDQALKKTFGLITDQAGGVNAVRDVPAGPLGGIMQCGTTKTDGGSMTVCGWADHGSLGIAMFPDRPVSESATLLLTMRNAIQHRG